MSRSRKADFRGNDLTNTVAEPQPLKTSRSHHQSVKLTFVKLTQTRADITAHRQHFQMRIAHAQHQLTAQAGGTNTCAGRHIVEGRVLRRHKRVARIFAFTHCNQFKPFGKLHRNVFEGMHGEISSPFEHRRLELLHKESLAAYLGKGAVENLVAARRHAKEFNLCPRITVAQKRLNVQSLPHGKRAFAGGDDASIKVGHGEYVFLLFFEGCSKSLPKRTAPADPQVRDDAGG